MRKCQIFMPFQDNILPVEELGGINNNFVAFNPDRSTGKPDYKLNLTEKMLLRFEGETELVSINDFDGEFIIVNSNGVKLADSTDVNPEFVDSLINDLIERQGQERPKGELN